MPYTHSFYYTAYIFFISHIYKEKYRIRSLERFFYLELPVHVQLKADCGDFEQVFLRENGARDCVSA